jgi:hypothetical protein
MRRAVTAAPKPEAASHKGRPRSDGIGMALPVRAQGKLPLLSRQSITGIAKIWEPRPNVLVPDYEEAVLDTRQGDVE